MCGSTVVSPHQCVSGVMIDDRALKGPNENRILALKSITSKTTPADLQPASMYAIAPVSIACGVDHCGLCGPCGPWLACVLAVPGNRGPPVGWACLHVGFP
eukprot:1147048-Pelagomonas_calceolata.AAC.2